MIVCSICTGRHETSACVIGRDRVDACFAAEVVPIRRPVIDNRPTAVMFDLDTYRAEREAFRDRRSTERKQRQRAREARLAP